MTRIATEHLDSWDYDEVRGDLDGYLYGLRIRNCDRLVPGLVILDLLARLARGRE